MSLSTGLIKSMFSTTSTVTVIMDRPITTDKGTQLQDKYPTI